VVKVLAYVTAWSSSASPGRAIPQRAGTRSLLIAGYELHRGKTTRKSNKIARYGCAKGRVSQSMSLSEVEVLTLVSNEKTRHRRCRFTVDENIF
jgi:cobyric acid synthase